jgi:hypothetical protein
MASSGTLLSDLTGDGGGGAMNNSGDNDLVKKIFADMNMGSQANPMMPSGMGGSGSMIMAPNPNTTQQMTMDNVPATSHIIGKDHPTAGDFAAAIHGVSRTEVAGMVPPPMPANGMVPQGQYAPYMGQQPQMMMMPQVPQKNMYARIADELKTPILVSILVFVFSLPFLNILFSHYAPMLLKPTGDLTSVGLLLKALAAGGAFWLLQRVIAPLVSL